MLEVIKKTIDYSGRFIGTTFYLSMTLLAAVPLEHLSAVVQGQSFLAVFIIGPTIGWLNFLFTNKKSLLAASAGVIGLSLTAPGLPIYALFAFGLGVDILWGIAESIVVHTKNHIEHSKAHDDAGDDGYALHFTTKGEREKYRESPDVLGPIGKGLFYNLVYATQFQRKMDPNKRYPRDENMVAHIGGFRRLN